MAKKNSSKCFIKPHHIRLLGPIMDAVLSILEAFPKTQNYAHAIKSVMKVTPIRTRKKKKPAPTISSRIKSIRSKISRMQKKFIPDEVGIARLKAELAVLLDLREKAK